MTAAIIIAAVFSMSVSGFVVYRNCSRLFEKHRKTEEELLQANRDLNARVSEMEQRNQEIILLSEMSSLLQTCVTAEEVYSVVSQSMQQLFSLESGAVYRFDAERNSLGPITMWGDSPPRADALVPNDCLALRRGRPHIAIERADDHRCRHLDPSAADSSLCVPIMAQGELLGLLHLQFSPGDRGNPEDMQRILEEHKQPLAVAVAETIAFSLLNLKLHKDLYFQSIHDPLTGLFNRRYMEESLERELRRMARKDRPLGIIMLDLDHFKRFNDKHGHQAGDALLGELGSFLQKNIREEDLACRYGGEEFMMILPEASIEATLQRAEELLKNVRFLEVRYRGSTLGGVTLSLGVAGYPEHGTSTDAILRAADLALYRAKAEGRNRVAVA